MDEALKDIEKKNAWTSGKDSISLKHQSMPAQHSMCDEAMWA